MEEPVLAEFHLIRQTRETLIFFQLCFCCLILFSFCFMLNWNQWNHRLNMELDLQSLFGLLCTLHLYSLAETETPPLPPPPHIWAQIRVSYWSATSLCNHLILTDEEMVFSRTKKSDSFMPSCSGGAVLAKTRSCL